MDGYDWGRMVSCSGRAAAVARCMALRFCGHGVDGDGDGGLARIGD